MFLAYTMLEGLFTTTWKPFTCNDFRPSWQDGHGVVKEDSFDRELSPAMMVDRERDSVDLTVL